MVITEGDGAVSTGDTGAQSKPELWKLTQDPARERVLVEPSRCRLWQRHQRRYDLLTESRCRDLIEGFRAQGGQEFPAIVRQVAEDPDYDYEIICGARRFWTVNWLREHENPQLRYFVEVRQLSDEESFRLSDVENRDKEDVSDYERALDYQKALALYYRTQKEMSVRLGVTEAWLSRYLALAAIPEEIVAAYGDVHDLRTYHATELKPILRSSALRERVIEIAQDIAGDQKRRRESGDQLLPGAEVVRRIKQVASGSPVSTRRRPKEYKGPNGKVVLTAQPKRQSVVLEVLKSSGADRQETLEILAEVMDYHFASIYATGQSAPRAQKTS